jgi:hypothetical protein
VALLPFTILENSQIFEEFANIYRFAPGHWDVMGCPRVRSYFVFAPARVASGLIAHFEKNEIAKASLLQTPCGTETGDAAADYDHRDFFDPLRCRENSAIAEHVPLLERLIHE